MGAAGLWLLPVVFLSVFFLYPLLTIFSLVFSGGGGGIITGSSGTGALDWAAIWKPLRFTILQALASTVLTLLVGLPSAYLFARFQFRGKSLLRVATTLPFILPTVVVAAAFNALLGPRGLVNLFLMNLLGLGQPPILFLNTLGAILAAHVFYNTTIVIRMVGTAWSHLDDRLAQAARVLGAGRLQVLWEVIFPLLRPAVTAAGLLVFIFDFTSFGVVLMLGGPRFATLEVEIYTQAMQMLNLPLAGLLSAIQLLCTLGMVILSNRLSQRGQVPLAPRPEAANLRPARLAWEKAFVWGCVTLLVLLLVSPLAALAARSVLRLDLNREQRGSVQPGFTLAYYQELFVNRRQSIFYVPPAAAVRNSLAYAGATVAISLSLGVLAAYGLRRKSWLSSGLGGLLMLPLGTSAVTLGLGYILVFSHPPLDARSLPWLLPVLHSIVALPFVVRTLHPALNSIPTSLRQSAAVLGASPLRAWFEVDLPIVARAGLVSAVFAFTVSLGEFGATSFLARPEYPTLPVAIYRFISQAGALNYGQALAMSTILMAVCALGILAMEGLRLPGQEIF